MIQMNNLTAESPALREGILQAVRRVIESGRYVLDAEVAAFEKRWARACGVAHAVGVANGMDAIEIALRAMQIGPGDEVITTPMTAFATVLAVIRAGATPVLADIDAQTGLLGIDSARRCITSKTRAVLPVHLYGRLGAMDGWLALCRERGLALVEDCAQAHGASFDGKVAGSFGNVGAYSFYPTKNLGALGDAGALITNDGQIDERARCLRNYGQTTRFHHPETGLNSRLDEMQAAILSERLGELAEQTSKRRAIAGYYHANIESRHITLLAKPQQESSHAYHLFVVTCRSRDHLQHYLNGQGIQSHVHYPVPIHHQPSCRAIRRDGAGLPHSETHAGTCLSIPIHPYLSEGDLQTIVRALNRYAGPI